MIVKNKINFSLLYYCLPGFEGYSRASSTGTILPTAQLIASLDAALDTLRSRQLMTPGHPVAGVGDMLPDTNRIVAFHTLLACLQI